MNISMLKAGIMSGLGMVGGFIATLFGGWNAAMTTLCIIMGVDLITGWIVAGVFKKSNKSETGGLDSKAGWKGFTRKVATVMIVLVAARLDLSIGTSFIKDAVVIGYIANETLSIIENLGLMGVWIPPVLQRAIDVLKKKDNTEI